MVLLGLKFTQVFDLWMQPHLCGIRSLLQICEPQHVCEWFVIQHISVVGHQGSKGYNTPEMKPCQGDVTFPKTQLWKG